jgi:hypothetical protein
MQRFAPSSRYPYLKIGAIEPNIIHLKNISVRPELVEGVQVSNQWFDKLTTNG